MGDCNGCGHPALFCACSQARDIDTSVCDPHPDAPHGFDRNGSHDLDRYVCTCEFWEAPEESDNPQPVSQTDRTMGDSVSDGYGSAHLRDRIAAAIQRADESVYEDGADPFLRVRPASYDDLADAVIAGLGLEVTVTSESSDGRFKSWAVEGYWEEREGRR